MEIDFPSLRRSLWKLPPAKKNRGDEITPIRLRPKFALRSAVNTAGKGFPKHGL